MLKGVGAATPEARIWHLLSRSRNWHRMAKPVGGEVEAVQLAASHLHGRVMLYCASIVWQGGKRLAQLAVSDDAGRHWRVLASYPLAAAHLALRPLGEGRCLVGAGSELAIWDPGHKIASAEIPTGATVLDLFWAPDDATGGVVYAGTTRGLYAWPIDRGEVIAEPGPEGPVLVLAGDGHTLWAGAHGGRIFRQA